MLITRKNGESLPDKAVQDLKANIAGEVLVRGEAPEETYRSAVHRWNEAYIEEAVSVAL